MHLEGTGIGIDCRRPTRWVERLQPAKEQLCMGTHEAQRHDDVTRLERARGCLRQEWREKHEVLEADDRRAALTEQPGDVRAGEAAAQDESAASCVTTL